MGEGSAFVYTFLMVVQFFVSIALIAVVLLQRSVGEGLGSIGGAQMFFDQAKGFDETLEKATTVIAVTFMVLSVLLVVLV
jgi:preprotein translocase subunit SecG